MQIRTLLYGEGLFETLLWRGETAKLRRHYKRLKNSAEFFQIPYPDYETFCQEIEKKTEGRKNLYVKFCLLSRGEAPYYNYPQESEILVIVKEFVPDRTPKKLCLSSIRRHSKNPVVYHKTMNYLTNILAKKEALLKGFDDAIILNERQEITECSASNILVLKDNKFFTPVRECGLLMGTTMEILIEKMNVKEERLPVNDLYHASAIFITNSLIGALPIVQFENKTYSIPPELTHSINSIIEEENTP